MDGPPEGCPSKSQGSLGFNNNGNNNNIIHFDFAG
jgi:hypothetical protein